MFLLSLDHKGRKEKGSKAEFSVSPQVEDYPRPAASNPSFLTSASMSMAQASFWAGVLASLTFSGHDFEQSLKPSVSSTCTVKMCCTACLSGVLRLLHMTAYVKASGMEKVSTIQ